MTLFVRPRPVAKPAAILKPAALLRLHKALVDRQYRYRLSSAGTRRKPDPTGPTQQFISAIIEMKHRNPRFGDRRIAQQITHSFGVQIDKDAAHQVLAAHYCRVDLFRCESILRILEVEEIQSVPYAPLSRPFIDRLIGTIRREYLDHTHFWNSIDLHRKLETFRAYHNGARVQRSLNGTLPANRAGNASSLQWTFRNSRRRLIGNSHPIPDVARPAFRSAVYRFSCM